MQFAVSAEQYDRFMGRYTITLAAALADAAGVREGQRVADVGCGPGGLTHELVGRVGAAQVAAIDPQPGFAANCRERNPGVEVVEGFAERLPWPDRTFDAALSSLVIGFMSDPDEGLREMARVTRPGGVVAACMWDHATGGMTMLQTFWAAVRAVHPESEGEAGLVGTTDGDIATRMERVGLSDVVSGALAARAAYEDFDDFWEPFMFGIGPAGQFLVRMPAETQARVRAECRQALPADGPFTLDARAWYACGTVEEHPRTR